MKFLFAGIVALLSALVAACASDKRIKIFNVLSAEDNENSLKIPLWLRILIVIGVGIFGFCSTLVLYENCSLTINIVRLQIGYICMAGAACVDLRENRIPNLFPAVMSLAGIVCLLLMFFTDSDGATAYIISSLAGAVVCAVCMIIVYVLTKGGIGMGDIKLLCALALLCGANALAGVATIGSITCGIVTIVLLVLKKKKLKDDALPFAPFAFLGFAVSVLLSIA